MHVFSRRPNARRLESLRNGLLQEAAYSNSPTNPSARRLRRATSPMVATDERPGRHPLDPGRIMRVQGRRHRPVGRLTHITRPCRAESKTTITETPPVKSWHQGTGREFVGTEPAHARRPGPPKTGSGRRSRHRRDCTPPTTESSPVARHSLQCGKSSRVHRSASRSITGRFRTAAFTGTARP